MVVKHYVTHICRDANKKYECMHTYVGNDLCYIVIVWNIKFISYICSVHIVKVIIVVLRILW